MLSIRRPLPLVLLASSVVLVFIWLSSQSASSVVVTNHTDYTVGQDPIIEPNFTAPITEDVKPPPVKQPSVTRTEYNDHKDEYVKITYTNHKAPYELSQVPDTVIMLSSIVDEKAYGEGKKFEDFFKTLLSMEYPRELISLGFLVGSHEEFKVVDGYFRNYFEPLEDLDSTIDSDSKIIKKYVNKVTILSAPFIERGFEVDRTSRHDSGVQRQRRRTIARSRNFLLLHGLQEERYTFFVDSDIIQINHKEMLNVFIESNKDIIVPRVEKDWDSDYDRNSWRGVRLTPSTEELEILDQNDWENFNFVPQDTSEMYHLHNSLDDPENAEKDIRYSVPLDSVGGAILFSKSVIYKQGIIFPTFYLIGATWNRFEGFDGIETEGLCYMAKTIGYECWAYPNLVAKHTSSDS